MGKNLTISVCNLRILVGEQFYIILMVCMFATSHALANILCAYWPINQICTMLSNIYICTCTRLRQGLGSKTG